VKIIITHFSKFWLKLIFQLQKYFDLVVLANFFEFI